MGELKTCQISFRVTATEKERIDALASASMRTPSDMARILVSKGLDHHEISSN